MDWVQGYFSQCLRSVTRIFLSEQDSSRRLWFVTRTSESVAGIFLISQRLWFVKKMFLNIFGFLQRYFSVSYRDEILNASGCIRIFLSKRLGYLSTSLVCYTHTHTHAPIHTYTHMHKNKHTHTKHTRTMVYTHHKHATD